MKILSLIAALMTFPGLFGQNYSTGHIKTVFRDHQRGNRRVPVDIFYPEAGCDSTLAGDTAARSKFPLICFGHGYLLSGEWYSYICDILVPEGYILVFPGSESGLFPSHMTLAEDMCFAMEEVSRLGREGSFQLYDRIDSAKCLMGHSMGGGSLFLAATLSKDLKAVVGLAPFNTKPSAVMAASSVGVPTLIFAGSNDCITPPDEDQIPIYESSSSPEKTYILIKGGTHCQMGVSHPKCSFGEKVARCTPGIGQQEQHLILARYLVPWLNFYMKGERGAGELFDSIIMTDHTINYMQTRPLTDNATVNLITGN